MDGCNCGKGRKDTPTTKKETRYLGIMWVWLPEPVCVCAQSLVLSLRLSL
jgi:hypothetical protein